MKKRPVYPFFLGVVILLPFLASPSLACECKIKYAYAAPPCALYWRSKAAFVGTVIDITNLPRRPAQSFDQVLVKFSVEQGFRGVEAKTVDVVTETGTSCSLEIARGERWLIYGEPSFVLTPEFKAAVEVPFCSGSHPLVGANDNALAYIRSQKKQPVPMISGLIYNRSLKGLKVTAEGYGKHYRTVTDNNGAFQISVAKPGGYKVRVFIPTDLEVYGSTRPSKRYEIKGQPVEEFEVDVPKDGTCGMVQFLIAGHFNKP